MLCSTLAYLSLLSLSSFCLLSTHLHENSTHHLIFSSRVTFFQETSDQTFLWVSLWVELQRCFQNALWRSQPLCKQTQSGAAGVSKGGWQPQPHVGACRNRSISDPAQTYTLRTCLLTRPQVSHMHIRVGEHCCNPVCTSVSPIRQTGSDFSGRDSHLGCWPCC